MDTGVRKVCICDWAKLQLRWRKWSWKFYSSWPFCCHCLRLFSSLYRFHNPWFDKYFDGDPATGQMEQYSPLPVTHIHLMRLWKAWLDKYPEHFITNPILAVSMLCTWTCWRYSSKCNITHFLIGWRSFILFLLFFSCLFTTYEIKLLLLLLLLSESLVAIWRL